MTPDEAVLDDDVLRRVANARPEVPEEDLSPTGERATAIVDRLFRAYPPSEDDAPRPHPIRGRRVRIAFGTLGLTAALAAVVLAVAGVFSTPPPDRGVPAADAIHLNPPKHVIPHATLVQWDRTPLGRAIAAGLNATQENVDTGSPAQNRKAIASLMRNELAGELAAAAVARVDAQPAQRRLQRAWVRGSRYQGTADRLLIASLHAFARGDTATGRRLENLADDAFDDGDGLTGWAENGLTGDPGPFPHLRN